MTRLLEHDALRLLSERGIAVPDFVVAAEAQEAAQATATFGGESVLKALIPVNGRASAGGVRIARSVEDAWKIAEAMLGEKVLGYRVDRLLVSRLVEAEWELAVLFAPDPETQRPTLFASALGGIDVADVARRDPAALVRRQLEHADGSSAGAARAVAEDLGLGAEESDVLVPALEAMYRAFTELGAQLLEINPLMIASDRSIVVPTATLVV